MSVEDNIQLIQAAFHKTKATRSLSEFESVISKYVSETPNEYVSVLYEGASIGIALESFKNGNSVIDWLPFYESYRADHSSQILVGLGWALFENEPSLALALDFLDPRQKWRVLDGYGFCYGLLRRGTSIRQQLIPETLQTSWYSAYYQGLGRSLWYISRGSVKHLVRMIKLFPSEFHSDLWRGAGIAINYVGGINTGVLSEIERVVDIHLPSFKCGAAIAIHSRKQAHSFSKDTLLVVRFFSINIEAAIKNVEDIECSVYTTISEYGESLKFHDFDF